MNIPEEIGTNYFEFGVLLLDDDNGARIRSIAQKHGNNYVQVNLETLEKWIGGQGKHPVTWKTLTEVLHDISLNTLAGEIEAVKQGIGI